MNVLLIGSGGREHALAEKLSQSAGLTRLFIAPGNGGTALVGENVGVDVTNHAAVVAFCCAHKIDLIVIGPEAPLVAGLADDLRLSGFDVFGPSGAAAQLEGSKTFTKTLCDEMNIPTAGYAHFDDVESALGYARSRGAPLVIKADGLAAGKGVSIAMSLSEAESAIRDCFSGSFGEAGQQIIIEEFMEGEEVSFFAVSDGENFVTLATAQDHKRAYDGDKGPNTGGMGAYSPAPVMTQELIKQVETEIIGPTLKGMSARGTPFCGVLYAGLILTQEGPKLIEYNARFGDPECQVLMTRMSSDLLELLIRSARGDMAGFTPAWSEKTALCVVLAAKGYPHSYEKGSRIGGADDLGGDNIRVYHAGTRRDENGLYANGGRVLNVVALAHDIEQAQKLAYENVSRIDWPEGFCRSDIGWRAIKREVN